MSKTIKVLVVDDEERLRKSLGKMLSQDGYKVSTAANADEGLELMASNAFDVAIIDMVMPGHDGMWLIREMKKKNIDMGIIVATGYGTIELAVNAMKLGAWDFVQKPVEYDMIKLHIDKTAEKLALIRGGKEYEKKIGRQKKELEKANKKLKELDLLKSNFLSKAVHELRTPLTIITCALEIARDHVEEKGPSELISHIANAKEFTKDMAAMINEMLDIYSIESGAIKLDLVSGDLFETLRHSAVSAMPIIEKNSLKLEINIPESKLPYSFSAGRIKQLLVNLIGNAVKFTPAGGSIKLLSEITENEVLISVEDTGCGVPAGRLDDIFNEFFQMDSSDKKGTGLGLAICKKIVEAHGGRIWAESEVGRGTSVKFALPAQPIKEL